jgi:NYN domain
LKSALFVDFDNVYSQLRQLQPEAAERFARHPSEWIGWLTGSLALPEPHDEAQKRRLLVRRCYLNPNWYQTYRHAFLRAGFEIVDCPPVTSQGKTSTDIHMVLDVVDLLQHETHYDEFIVFSADADFTPVLRKLRRFDRRTTVLAIGFPSAAYQASADLLIDERVFIQDALGLRRAAAEAAPAANGPTIEAVDAVRPADSRPVAPDAKPVPSASAAAKPEHGAKVSPRAATPEDLATIAHRIWTTVDESTGPVSAALLASRLKQEFPEVTENWNGCGTFKAFFRSLKLSRLAWLSGSGGRILDPIRHEVDGASADQEPDSPWAGSGGMFPVVREVCSFTGAPMLAPKDLRVVITLLARELREHGFELAVTARRVCSRCLETEGLRVRQRDVTFLLRGMQLNGHVFGQGHDDEHTLASRLVDQVLFLCAREQMVLDEAAVGHIRHWIAGMAVL